MAYYALQYMLGGALAQEQGASSEALERETQARAALEERVAELVASMRAVVDVPVTVKHRIGVDELEVWYHHPIYFPDSALIGAADGAQLNAWITEVDPSQDPNHAWARCYRLPDGKGNFLTAGSHFHHKCNGLGPTVTVAQLDTGKLIGGYAGVSWTSSNGWVSSSTSFLFSLTTMHRHGMREYDEQTGGDNPPDRAQYHHQHHGPARLKAYMRGPVD